MRFVVFLSSRIAVMSEFGVVTRGEAGAKKVVEEGGECVRKSLKQSKANANQQTTEKPKQRDARLGE